MQHSIPSFFSSRPINSAKEASLFFFFVACFHFKSSTIWRGILNHFEFIPASHWAPRLYDPGQDALGIDVILFPLLSFCLRKSSSFIFLFFFLLFRTISKASSVFVFFHPPACKVWWTPFGFEKTAVIHDRSRSLQMRRLADADRPRDREKEKRQMMMRCRLFGFLCFPSHLGC